MSRPCASTSGSLIPSYPAPPAPAGSRNPVPGTGGSATLRHFPPPFPSAISLRHFPAISLRLERSGRRAIGTLDPSMPESPDGPRPLGGPRPMAGPFLASQRPPGRSARQMKRPGGGIRRVVKRRLPRSDGVLNKRKNGNRRPPDGSAARIPGNVKCHSPRRSPTP